MLIYFRPPKRTKTCFCSRITQEKIYFGEMVSADILQAYHSKLRPGPRLPGQNPLISMGLPKKKMTRARRNKRRKSYKHATLGFTLCRQCKKSIPLHRACPYCGRYRGRVILDLEAKTAKKLKKQKAKAKNT